MPRSTVRIASCQYYIRPVQTFDEFAVQVSSLAATASDYKADLLIYPEYFSIQLFTLSDTSRPASTLVRDITTYVPRCVELLSGLAKRYGMYIVGGSMPVAHEEEPAADGSPGDEPRAQPQPATGHPPRIYNRSYLFSPSGGLGYQDKLHMTRWEAEEWEVSQGDRLRIFQTELGPLAIAICYDVEFPELARAAARAGCYMLLAPSCTDDRQGYLRVRYCAQARAIENTMYVAHACTVGSLPMVPAVSLNYGCASILTPSDFPFARDGILAEGNINQEMIVIGDVNLDTIRAARSDGTVLPLRDSVTTDAVTAAMDVVEL